MLFDTPGLTITASTATASPAVSSKPTKRKRASDVASPALSDSATALNLDKLMKRMRAQDPDNGWKRGELGPGGKSGVDQTEKDLEQKRRADQKRAKKREDKANGGGSSVGGAVVGGGAKEKKEAGTNRFKPEKKVKAKKVVTPAYSPASAANRTWAVIDQYANNATASSSAADIAMDSSSQVVAPAQVHGAPANYDDEAEAGESEIIAPQTAMQKALRAKLSGGKFRMLNEKLYTSTGQEARETMQEEGAFDDYHAGFRSQSAHWPVHPMLIFTKALSTLPANSLIVDFGAGDAQLAQDLSKLPVGLKVISFDLVSKNGWVVVAECSSVPLPGNGGKIGGGEIVDVVVCCLSLMGTDWIGMVREARRILKVGGQLKIAEVTSRFTDLDGFVNLIKSLGFKLAHKDTKNTHFVMFDFIKLAESGESNKKDKGEMSKLSETLLKPCIYKKR